VNDDRPAADLKRAACGSDIRRMRPAESPSGGPADGLDAEAAFGPPPAGVQRRTTARLRLLVLLACLLGAALALLDLRGSWFGLGASGAATGSESAAVCQGRRAPEVAQISAHELPGLRHEISGIMPPRVGREYEAGVITSTNLWSDDEPAHSIWARVSSGPVPAGYEVRWWALDREGSEDDIVVDALQFATQAEAKDALTLALVPGCRRRGAVQAASFPAGASNLFWVNPDRVGQWDAIFVRGRRLYRVSDVPPEYPRGPGPDRRRPVAAKLTVDALACALPGADCATSRASLRDTSLASLTSGSAIGPRSGPPPTRAQAAAYASAVNVRSYDLPESVTVAGEGPTHDRGYWEAFARCSGRLRSMHAVVAIHSPAYSYPGYLRFESVYSTVTVLPSESAANRYLAVLESARARSCIASLYQRWLTGEVAKGSLLQLRRLTVTELPTSVPASYRGNWRYRAIALRLEIPVHYTPGLRGGAQIPVDQTASQNRSAQFTLYIEGFAFAFGRAVVELTAFTTFHPFPQANQHFLESVLVGRAEAYAGQPR
jgi:hypothetical protein